MERPRAVRSEAPPRRAIAALLASLAILVLASLETPGTEEEAAARRAASGHAGSESCFACHRGMVHEMASLAHAPLMDSGKHRGCEECHGPGQAHVDALGAKGTILSQKAGSDPRASNASCIACHQFDAESNGCFDRLERGEGPLCASCHRVHPGTGRVAGPSADFAAKRDRSPLRGPTDGKEKDLPPLAAAEPEPLEVTGEVTAGYRFVGDESPQFEQDVNLDQGPRLLDFRLDGRLLDEKRLFDRFLVTASGIDDPFMSIRGEAESYDSWEFEGGFRKWDNVYLSGADPHSYFVKREQIDGKLEIRLSDDVELTLAYSQIRRSGTADQSRYVFDLQNELFLDAPEDVDQTTHSGDVAVEFPLGSVFRAVARQSLVVHENDDERSFSEPIEEFPFEEFERFRSEARTITPQTTLKVWGDPIEDELRLEGGALVANAEGEIDVDGEDGGIDENLNPFSSLTDGEADVSRSTEAFFLAGSLQVTDAIAVAARYDFRHEDDDGDVFLVETTDDGGSIVTIDDSKVRSRTHRAGGDVLYDATDTVALRAGYEYFHEDLEVSYDEDNPEVSNQGGGPYFGADWRPSTRFAAKALVRSFDLRDPYTEISPEDDDSARLTLKWKPEDGLSLRGDADYRVQRSRYVIVVDESDGESRIETASAGATATWAVTEPLDLHASYAYQNVNSGADTVFYFNFVPVFDEAVFDGDSHTGTIGALFRATPKLRFNLDAVGVSTGGDYTYQMLDFRVGAAYDLRDDLTLSGEARRIMFDEAERNDNDYTTWVGLVAVTWRF